MPITQRDILAPRNQVFGIGDLVGLVKEALDLNTKQRFRITTSYYQRFDEDGIDGMADWYEMIDIDTGSKYAWFRANELVLILEDKETKPGKENIVRRDAIRILDEELRKVPHEGWDPRWSSGRLLSDFVRRVKMRLTRELRESRPKSVIVPHDKVVSIIIEHYAREHHRDVKIRFSRTELRGPVSFLTIVEDIEGKQ